MTSRIYRIDDGLGDRLIRANNQSQAVRFASQRFAVRVASQRDLESLLTDGVRVEDATAEPVAPDTNVGGNPLGDDAE